MVAAPEPLRVCVPAPFAVVDRVIQGWLALAVAVQLPNALLFELEIATDCADGLLDPDVAMNERLEAETVSAGGGGDPDGSPQTAE